MKTKLFSVSNTEELKELEFPNWGSDSLAIIFSSLKNNNKEILLFTQNLGFQTIITSTSGQFSNSGFLLEGAIIILFKFPKDSFKISFVSKEDNFFKTGEAVGEKALSSFSKSTAIVFASGLDLDNEDIVDGFEKATNEEIPIFGGFAGNDNFKFTKTFIGFNSEISHQGVILLSFDSSKISLKGVVADGWKKIGTPKKITKSDGNRVFEIDGIPIKKVYERYFNFKDTNEIDPLQYASYPILVPRENGSEVKRIIIGVDKDSIHYSKNIKEGSEIYFCSPAIVEAVEGAVRELGNFQQRENLLESDFILEFSCVGRLVSFTYYILNEIAALKEMWGDKFAGLFSYGEIGAIDGKRNQLHTNVLSTVFIKDLTEDSVAPKTKLIDPKSVSTLDIDYLMSNCKSGKIDTGKLIDSLQKEKEILTTLLHQTSRDLEEAFNSLELQKQKSEELLLNVLPQPIAERLKADEGVIADRFNKVTVLFADIVGFTKLSQKLSATELVHGLNDIFSKFDRLTKKYGLEKIKTIGDAYMVVGGVPTKDDSQAYEVSLMAIDIMKIFEDLYIAGEKIGIRIGINSGEAVAGVIGESKFSYDLWGDTVNTASRMESHGEKNRIHVSENLKEEVADFFEFSFRGEIEVKGKGKMKTWWLESKF